MRGKRKTSAADTPSDGFNSINGIVCFRYVSWVYNFFSRKVNLGVDIFKFLMFTIWAELAVSNPTPGMKFLTTVV